MDRSQQRGITFPRKAVEPKKGNEAMFLVPLSQLDNLSQCSDDSNAHELHYWQLIRVKYRLVYIASKLTCYQNSGIPEAGTSLVDDCYTM